MTQMGIAWKISESSVQAASARASKIRALLCSPAYSEINSWFDAKRRGVVDRPWYSAGPSNLRELARALAREGEYEVIYGPASDVTHATSLSRQVRFSAARMHMTPIRHLAGVDSLIRVLAILAFRTYRVVLDRYRPDETPNFARKYDGEWRTAFLNIPSVSYDESTSEAVDL